MIAKPIPKYHLDQEVKIIEWFYKWIIWEIKKHTVFIQEDEKIEISYLIVTPNYKPIRVEEIFIQENKDGKC